MRTWMRPYVYAAWLVTPFRLWNNICICKYSIVADHNAKIDLYTKPYYTALIDNWRQQHRPLK